VIPIYEAIRGSESFQYHFKVFGALSSDFCGKIYFTGHQMVHKCASRGFPRRTALTQNGVTLRNGQNPC
jgi:hypothetical protein